MFTTVNWMWFCDTLKMSSLLRPIIGHGAGSGIITSLVFRDVDGKTIEVPEAFLRNLEHIEIHFEGQPSQASRTSPGLPELLGRFDPSDDIPF